jgi:hypothetical protein
MHTYLNSSPTSYRPTIENSTSGLQSNDLQAPIFRFVTAWRLLLAYVKKALRKEGPG